MVQVICPQYLPNRYCDNVFIVNYFGHVNSKNLILRRQTASLCSVCLYPTLFCNNNKYKIH